jgi:hypothetical protein
MWKMNSYEKQIRNVTQGIFLILGTQKESIFWGKKTMLIFLNTSIANYLMYFLDN